MKSRNSHQELVEGVIPLPREASIRAVHGLAASDVTVELPEPAGPLAGTVRETMAPLTSDSRGRCRIRFCLLDGSSDSCPAALAIRLKALPNADQAYAIVPEGSGGSFAGLSVFSETDLGLLYGARTLRQMMFSSLRGNQQGETEVEVPELTLVDWPDIGERGQWGGSASTDLVWLAERKFNVVEYAARLSCDATGKGSAVVAPALLDEAARVGIKIVPYITHLELLFQIYNLFEQKPEIASTPDPDQPLPSDYSPGVCFSNPESTTVLEDWLSDLVRIPGVRDVMVWLSEAAAPCYCEKCSGKEPFTMEIAAISRAFDSARKHNPDAVLRVLLTQGSYKVNDKVLDAAPEHVKITYYHGGLTYDSSHNPMIYPRLAAFAESGRWLGVYPQVTASWRSVTPFTGPQFVRTRMNEFVEKGLSNVITYAVPANRFHEFNVTAAAEWTWNGKGRTDRAFARAWAESKGVADPDLYSRWATTIGLVGWSLAGSRLALRLIFSAERQLLDGSHPIRFGEGVLAEIYSAEDLASRLHEADRALALALDLEDEAAIAESRITQAYLLLAGGLQALSHAPLTGSGLTAGELARYRCAFEDVDRAARTLEVEHYRWTEAVAGGELPGRLLDTIAIAYRAAASAAGVISRLGLVDPTPEYRSRKIGTWSTDDFGGDEVCSIVLDLASIWAGPGPYVVTFEYTEGTYGVDIERLTLDASSADGQEHVLDEVAVKAGVNRHERWREVRLVFPNIGSGDRPMMRAGLKFPDRAPKNLRVSNGVVTARRGLWIDGQDMRDKG